MSCNLFCRFAHGLLQAACDVQKLCTSIETGGEPHSAFHYRRHCSSHGLFRSQPRVSGGSLAPVTGPANVQGHAAWHGSRGVAVVANQNRCAPILGRRHPRHSNRECNAPPSDCLNLDLSGACGKLDPQASETAHHLRESACCANRGDRRSKESTTLP